MILNNNQYYTGLTNLALYVSTHVLNRSNRTAATIDTFTTESIPYGDTKVFRALPLPGVDDYSKTSSLLGDHTPNFTPTGEQTAINVWEEAISISNKKVIKNSYSKAHLLMAVSSETGANEFISVVLGNIDAAKNDFLYDKIVDLLFSSTYGKSETVTLLDTSNITNPTELQAAEIINNKRIAKTVQKAIDGMTHYTGNYNVKGMKQSVDLSDLRLVVMQPYKNNAVVDLFAELLNSQYISENFPKPELLTIPEVKASAATGYDNKVICILMHKNVIQLFYKLVFMGEFFDPSTLRVNNFLHFWYALGKLDQLPSCKISIASGE